MEKLHEDPEQVFSEWLQDAKQEFPWVNATPFTLCTVDLEGNPNARTVLLQSFKENGASKSLIWMTSDQGAKGPELERNGFVAALFLWDCKKWTRQPRIRGKNTKAAPDISQLYFDLLPRQFQIGTWSSRQSTAIDNLDVLDKSYQENVKKFEGVEKIPCPPHYCAYYITPESYEFFERGDILIHNRRRKYIYKDGSWSSFFLSP